MRYSSSPSKCTMPPVFHPTITTASRVTLRACPTRRHYQTLSVPEYPSTSRAQAHSRAPAPSSPAFTTQPSTTISASPQVSPPTAQPLPLVAVVNAPTATACTSRCCRRHVCRLPPPRAQVILCVHILGHASHKNILSDSIVSQGLRWRRTHKHAVCTAELSGGASLSQPLHLNVFHIGRCI